MFLLILSFPTQILSIFGESFKEGKTILLILATGKLISSLSGSVGIILQMTGNQQIYKRIMIMALFINLNRFQCSLKLSLGIQVRLCTRLLHALLAHSRYGTIHKHCLMVCCRS